MGVSRRQVVPREVYRARHRDRRQLRALRDDALVDALPEIIFAVAALKLYNFRREVIPILER